MNARQAYDTWAAHYDTNHNRTRDLEGQALRQTLAGIAFGSCLEIGCGTGKNTEWLIGRAKQLTAVDLSGEMLAKAKEKITSKRVQFKQADITENWDFRDGLYDLVTFSLVLEHIENLGFAFGKAAESLNPGGYVYIGELHPFKQYSGSKAWFDTEAGQQTVECFNHHVSEFVQAAKKHGLSLVDLNEFFDGDDRTGIPRILTVLFRKS